jgi:hypothetical protein
MTDRQGALVVEGHWPPGAPPGSVFWVQAWISDPDGPLGFAASNALAGTAP